MIKNLDFIRPPKNILTKTYSLEKVTATEVLYKPIKIFHYELIPSSYNKDKKVLVAQIGYYDKDKEIYKTLFTESFYLIKALEKEETNDTNIALKIIKSKDKDFFYPVKVSKSELELLDKLGGPK